VLAGDFALDILTLPPGCAAPVFQMATVASVATRFLLYHLRNTIIIIMLCWYSR
jgi:hypothetical protein